MSTRTPAPPPIPTEAGGRRPHRRWWQIALIAVVAVVGLGAIMTVATFAWQRQQQTCVKASDPTRSGAITEYCPSDPYQPIGGAMTFGPNGNLWYTTNNNTKIARFSLPSGAFTSIAAPSPPNQVAYAGIVQGSDGNIWYIANYTLGRITPSGVVKEFVLPKELGLVGGIAAGPNGVLWVQTNVLLKITVPNPSDATAAPHITQVAGLPTNTGGPMVVTADGSLWIVTSEMRGNTAVSAHLTRITPTGAITQLPVTIPSGVTALAAGPDGTLWYINGANQGQIGRIIPATGANTVFRVSQIGEMGSLNLAVRSDGTAWFSTKDGGIGRITPTGAITTFTLPHSSGMLTNLTAGPDGGIWAMQGWSQPGQPSSRFVRITP